MFYMNYNLYPQAVPWNDTIRKAVKFLKGYEYTISKPRDLWFAVTEMVSKIVKTKQVRRWGNLHRVGHASRRLTLFWLGCSRAAKVRFPRDVTEHSQNLAPFVASPQPIVDKMLDLAG